MRERRKDRDAVNAFLYRTDEILQFTCLSGIYSINFNEHRALKQLKCAFNCLFSDF